MKTLLLMRHAKSSWADPTLSDLDRPLNKRGTKAAPRMGKFMRKQGVRLDLVLSSPARRAAQTSKFLMDAADIECDLRHDERLYGAGAAELLEVVRGIEESCDGILLVGHNPGMEDFVELLTGKAEAMPTAALAKVALHVERWADVRESSGDLEWLVRPKELKRR
jgi:phosphohistidine phosphatase